LIQYGYRTEGREKMTGLVGLALAVGYLSFFAWVDVKIGATKPWWK
jgi:hypothetical protein